MMFFRLSSFTQAAIMLLTAYFMFCTADIVVKILSAHYPIAVCIFIPSAIATLMIGTQIFIKQGVSGFKTSYLKWHILRSLVMATIIGLFVGSLKFIPIADFYCLVFATPFLMTVASIILYKERVPLLNFAILMVSFVGVIIAVGPRFQEFNIGYFLAVLGVLFNASYIFLVRKIGADDPPSLMGFAPLLCVAGFSAPLAIVDFPTSMLPMSDILLFLLYTAAIIIAHYLYPLAFAKTELVSRLIPLHYSQIVWGTLASIFIFETPLNINTAIGVGLVLLSGISQFFIKPPAKSADFMS